MDWPSFLQKQFPQILRSGASLIARKMAETPEPEDISEKFAHRRLAAFEVYEKKILAAPAVVSVPEQQETVPEQVEEERRVIRPVVHRRDPEHEGCPYCQLEESAGIVRNHLAFVAKECKDNELGPATGGMVPKAKAQNRETMQRAQALVIDGGPAMILGGAIVKLGEGLDPKLQWISTCAEAEQVALIAQRMWEIAAKSAQMNFSGTRPGR